MHCIQCSPVKAFYRFLEQTELVWNGCQAQPTKFICKIDRDGDQIMMIE